MRQIVVFAISCIVTALSASPVAGGGQGVNIMYYELYSWKNPHGYWNFCVLPSPSGRNISGEEVFDNRTRLTGMSELKHKISQLPEGATIIWVDHISPEAQPKAAGSQKVGFPPRKMIREIQVYAATRKITVDASPSPKGKG